jgi:hypothetical protein
VPWERRAARGVVSLPTNNVVKMFGAPIEPTDTKIIIDYLVTNYGSGD